MDEKSELGDIILNKGNKNGNNKKIILAAATLGIILIVVVLLMNTLNSDNTNNLPQSTLPPQPIKDNVKQNFQKEEPLFEDVEVIDEENNNDNDEDKKLEQIAKELKEQTALEKPKVEEVAPSKAKVVSKPKIHKKEQKREHQAAKKSISKRDYYIQVGSFTKYKPNRKFLATIKKYGYSYTFYKTTIKGKSVTKVLIGPFKSEYKARRALKTIRKQIEKGAFITKIH